MSVAELVSETLPVKFRPRDILPTPIYKRLRYIVYTPEGWIYYFAKIGSVKGKYAKFEKAPPVRQVGYFAHERKFYPVNLRDLIRSQVNVSPERSLTLKQLIGLHGESTAAPSSGETLVVHNEQPISGDAARLQAEYFDLARDEQIEALLATEDSEEEW